MRLLYASLSLHPAIRLRLRRRAKLLPIAKILSSSVSFSASTVYESVEQGMNYFLTECSCIREPKTFDNFRIILRSFPVTQIVVSMQVLLPMTRFPLHLTTLLL